MTVQPLTVVNESAFFVFGHVMVALLFVHDSKDRETGPIADFSASLELLLGRLTARCLTELVEHLSLELTLRFSKPVDY